MTDFTPNKKEERGAALVEFAIAATVFLTVMFGVVEFGRVLWAHNALTDATRRGARYAVFQCNPNQASCPNSGTSVDRIKKVVVYGDPAGGTQPLMENLTESNVTVNYSAFALDTGTVTVGIQNYKFNVVLPLIVKSVDMPNYTTTLTAENAGWVPPNS
ncbi:MAG: TadE family protein [Pyrinomonadaceae bacterium]